MQAQCKHAFITAFDRIGQFDDGRAFGPWFYRIVVNLALKVVRGRQRFAALPDEEPQGDYAGPEEELLRWETREQVQAALERLPAEQRAVVVLRYYLEMTEAEIAETLGCPVGTVKWRMHAARLRLRRGLEGEHHA